MLLDFISNRVQLFLLHHSLPASSQLLFMPLQNEIFVEVTLDYKSINLILSPFNKFSRFLGDDEICSVFGDAKDFHCRRFTRNLGKYWMLLLFQSFRGINNLSISRSYFLLNCGFRLCNEFEILKWNLSLFAQQF